MKKSIFPSFVAGVATMLVLIAGTISQAQIQFTDVTTQVGLVQEAKKSWGNPVWGDINNDGYLDLIVPCHGLPLSHGPFVYLNNAGQSFTDIRTTCGIGHGPELDSLDWHGFSLGDYDNDGNLDLYIAEGAKGNHGGTTKRDLLFHGRGDGTFTYVSDTAGIETSENRGRCGFWFDYNNDGKLDLFVKNDGGNNPLYQNNGDGTFTKLSVAGLSDAVLGRHGDSDCGSIMSFADYDNDGYLDVMITGDCNVMNLYRNNGDGTFVDVTSAAGIVWRRGAKGGAKGIAWGDYDNDGYPDLFIAQAHTRRSGAGGTLFHNNGDGTFTDVTSSAGVSITGSCEAAVWGDYDSDGYLDLFITNAGDTGQGPGNHNFLFHNNGNGTFTDVAAATGTALEDDVALHKGACWVDYDNDGFLDLMVKDGVGNEGDNGPDAFGLHRLLRNSGNSNHYLAINLRGVQSNGRGIGARVKVTSSNGLAYRQNNGGGGGEHASQGSQPLHFGLGAATSARVVVVKWPSGVVDKLHGVQADQIITVTEGSSP